MAKGAKKPLNGAKKYSLIPQACTASGCDEEFWVSLGSTPAQRWCEEHWFGRKKDQEVRRTKDEQMKFVLSFLDKSK